MDYCETVRELYLEGRLPPNYSVPALLLDVDIVNYPDWIPVYCWFPACGWTFELIGGWETDGDGWHRYYERH